MHETHIFWMFGWRLSCPVARVVDVFALCRRILGSIPKFVKLTQVCHQLVTNATLHCVPYRKLRRWATPTHYNQTVIKQV